MDMAMNVREKMAARAAKELNSGMIVNLGIGIPTLVANFIATDCHVLFHAENGVLGSGPSPQHGMEDPNLCNAGGYPITIQKGASYMDSATAFAIIRRGRLDATILGALQVNEKGDLANWLVPGKRVPGMGGAMELAQKAKRVIVLMRHVNSEGEPKIVKQCSYPLTAKQCVDLIITDFAVIEKTEGGLYLREVFAPHTIEEVLLNTGAKLVVERKKILQWED
ncbi:3-oxoacid CoA-transferase subunit B [Halalkalibacterium ligniniphilum]|uniref:3-oxoacid CoA-transferase subunit B n=1 Tax=Halalkalibacterium ligniniphilum TaxID=1134413 RepID=UPI000347847F|nr:3-oxoacid CoA-transferase subunit B [Halalkalibacterium ligniniphilum]